MDPIHRPGLVRVVLTGPESVGKTTLAAQLAARFAASHGAVGVPEFVRDYARGKGAPLDFTDHGPIARGQMALESAHAARAGRLLVQDTDLLSTVVYCHHYFGRCPAFIEEAAVARRPAHYLLLDTDVPWIADGVRDRGDRRDELLALFRDTLARLAAPYELISGDWATREAAAVEAIHRLLPPP